ncbi:HEXXH motif domain-containing protein [Kutzneria sp. NPDC051319]|uniref:HEXXH motif domain-containing protein n=1 Tax=Kutzneria sp. NPDC051319 TaxID=3155047 RepID=UPI00343B1459
MLTTHGLGDEELASIARGRGGAKAVRKLRAGYHSKVLVILRALLDEAPDDPGSPPLAEAWDLLIKAERADPVAVADVLGLTEVQGWAAETMRLLATTKDSDRLSPFLGQLHAVAAAAAIRAGVDCTVRVPAVEGVIALPGLGTAVLSSHDHGEVMATSRGVSVRTPDGTRQLPEALTEDGPDWLAHRRIRCTHAGRVLDVRLDDIQPFRFSSARPRQRLTADEVEGWQQRLDRAWRLLATKHPDIADELAAGMSALVPKAAASRFRLSSASSTDAFGTMEAAPVEDAATMASVLIHEFAHSKLNGVSNLITLDIEDRHAKYYAPWRDDPRPLHGLLHGAFSFLAVTDFWQHERHENPLWNLEFATRRGQVGTALEAIAGSDLLTEAGALFVREMTAVADSWADSKVDQPVQEIADRVLADHRATWRIRHLRPSADRLRRVLELRRTGSRWPGEDGGETELAPTLEPMVEPRARTHLAQWSLREPATFAGLTAETVAREIPGATAADLALVRGDGERARTLYVRQIGTDPHDHRGWVGLGLATDAHAALACPEIVRAVHLAEPGDPEELLAWFGGVTAARSARYRSPHDGDAPR